MAESVSVRVNQLSSRSDAREMAALLTAQQEALEALAAKLDADEGVTDTDYGETLAQIVTK